MNRILVIDDDEELCGLLIDYLGPEGFTVEAVYDSATGIERALSGDHDFVVLDVMLPGVNGFEVLRTVRKTSGIPVPFREEQVPALVVHPSVAGCR